MFLFDPGDGTVNLHADIKGQITKSRLVHFKDVFNHLLAGLMDRGLGHLDAWVEMDNETQFRFAEYFGFEPTGRGKILYLNDGRKLTLIEMTFELMGYY